MSKSCQRGFTVSTTTPGAFSECGFCSGAAPRNPNFRLHEYEVFENFVPKVYYEGVVRTSVICRSHGCGALRYLLLLLVHFLMRMYRDGGV